MPYLSHIFFSCDMFSHCVKGLLKFYVKVRSRATLMNVSLHFAAPALNARSIIILISKKFPVFPYMFPFEAFQYTV